MGTVKIGWRLVGSTKEEDSIVNHDRAQETSRAGFH